MRYGEGKLVHELVSRETSEGVKGVGKLVSVRDIFYSLIDCWLPLFSIK